MATAEADDLITEVTHLPVLPGAAMRLLWMVDDPRASDADLGRLIESDAVLSTHVIGLANTPFYGLTGKVSSAWHAVGVLGPATVRAIATAAAFDLFSDERRSVPTRSRPQPPRRRSRVGSARSRTTRSARDCSTTSVPRSCSAVLPAGATSWSTS